MMEWSADSDYSLICRPALLSPVPAPHAFVTDQEDGAARARRQAEAEAEARAEERAKARMAEDEV